MKKIVCIVLVSVIGLCVFVVAAFYFYPVPQAVKQVVEKDILHDKISRCIASTGIVYDVLPVLKNDSSHIVYNSIGNIICTVGGEASKKDLSGSCRYKLCFPVYGK